MIDHYEPHIVTAQDYYPFGMLSRVSLPNSGKSYKFGFNGKMNDDEVKGGLGNQQDYGMRIYDPRVGRFLSVDPLTKQYPHYTPYSFAGNKPITSVDRDGEEEALELRTRKLEEALLNHEISEAEYKKKIVTGAMGGAIAGPVIADLYFTGGATTKTVGPTLMRFIYFNYLVEYTNRNSNQHDPKIRAENEKKAREAAANLIIGFGSDYLFSKGLQAGKMFFSPNVLKGAMSQLLSKGERLKIFTERLTSAQSATSQEDAINLINKTLDAVEDEFSGIQKAQGIPDRDDGRMYGILDEKYVKTLEDGTKVADTKGNRIVLGTNGSIEIQTKDGSKTLFTKPGVKKQ